jgi:hypothetical protein
MPQLIATYNTDGSRNHELLPAIEDFEVAIIPVDGLIQAGQEDVLKAIKESEYLLPIAEVIDGINAELDDIEDMYIASNQHQLEMRASCWTTLPEEVKKDLLSGVSERLRLTSRAADLPGNIALYAIPKVLFTEALIKLGEILLFRLPAALLVESYIPGEETNDTSGSSRNNVPETVREVHPGQTDPESGDGGGCGCAGEVCGPVRERSDRITLPGSGDSCCRA